MLEDARNDIIDGGRYPQRLGGHYPQRLGGRYPQRLGGRYPQRLGGRYPQRLGGRYLQRLGSILHIKVLFISPKRCCSFPQKETSS
jgi:hypothetical protein